MLTIRDAQLAALRDSRLTRFVDDMVAYMATEYPLHCQAFEGSGLQDFVERSIASAATLGINGQGAIGVLTELRLLYGEAFERAPDREWVRNILAHKTLPGHIKLEAIQDRIQQKTGGRLLVPFQAPASGSALPTGV